MLRHGQRKTSGVRSRFGRDGTGPYKIVASTSALVLSKSGRLIKTRGKTKNLMRTYVFLRLTFDF